MKRIVLIASLVAIGSLYGYKADAQVRFNVSVNIGTQPAWGPVGYDYAEYYYMPDIDCYYNVPERQFIYLDGGRWCFAAALPARYHYDLYRGYKVVVNEPRPYMRSQFYRDRYAGYRGAWGRQTIIRDSRNPRYFAEQRGGGYNPGRHEGGGFDHGRGPGGRFEGGPGGHHDGGPRGGFQGGPGRGHDGGHNGGPGRGHEGGPGRGNGGGHGDHGRHGH